MKMTSEITSTSRFYPITSLITSLTPGPIKGKTLQMNPVQRASHTAAEPVVWGYPV